MHRTIAALLLAAALPSLAAAQQQQEPKPKLALATCRLPGWTTDVRCGTLEVFENRRAKTGRTIALRVVVLLATGGHAAPDPIFYFAGGPGASAVDTFAAAGAGYLADLRKDRDVVLVDQRGTGGSNPLVCNLAGDRTDMPAYFANPIPLDRVRACRAELEQRADLTLYSTDLAAEDVDDVRAALGYEKIDLYGGSYGSTAALVYLRKFPARVRTATVLGVAPPDMKLPLPISPGVENALARVFADVAADPATHAELPDPKADLTAALARLEHAVPVEARNPFTGASQTVSLTRQTFLELVRLMLYQPAATRWLPLLLHQSAGGEFGLFVTIGYQTFRGVEDLIARGMHFSVTCAEDLAFITDADAKAATAGTVYGDARLSVYRAVCAIWPRADVPASFATPVRSDVPVLLVAGEADPVTPPWLAEAAAKSLSNGRVVVVPHTGHMFAFPCVDALVAAFVAKGSAAGLDASCLSGVARPPFVTQRMLDAAANTRTTEAPPAAGEERWEGVLDVGAAKLRLVVRVVAAADGARTATLDSPDQGAYGLAIDSIVWTGPSPHFEMRLIGATFEGTRSADGATISGTWKQGANAWPLELRRATAKP